MVRPTTKILDYAITKEVIKETHYEVTIKAAVGNLSKKNCSNNNIINLTAYKPILSLDSAAPSWLAPVLNGLYFSMITDIENRKNIELTKAMNTRLNAVLLKSTDDVYDYTSLTSGRVRTEVGSFAYVPRIRMYIDTKSSSINNETFLIMEITSNLYDGFTYKKSSSKSHKISLKLSNRSPWRTINVLSKPSKELISEALLKSAKKHIDALFSELDCKSLKANLKFDNQIKKLHVSLGKKHGLSLKMPEDEAEARDILRARAKGTTDKTMDLSIKGKLGMVIDGTGRDYDKIARQKAILDQLGYDCYMIFVNTSLEVALERNKRRERSVPEYITRKSHAIVQSLSLIHI